ncbi:hypothetical protein [Nonomuraea maritima]|uniref:hypothetical protein n=1 Tax=Nonomuraea maritima TaxID=683260 RepID=UPI003CCB8029
MPGRAQVRPTFLVNGHVHGTWSLEGGTLCLTPFRPLSTLDQAALERRRSACFRSYEARTCPTAARSQPGHPDHQTQAVPTRAAPHKPKEAGPHQRILLANTRRSDSAAHPPQTQKGHPNHPTPTTHQKSARPNEPPPPTKEEARPNSRPQNAEAGPTTSRTPTNKKGAA